MATTDDRPTAELWAELEAAGPASLTGDRCDGLVHEVQRRGERETLDHALPWLTHGDAWRREVAAWVLAQLGYPTGRPFGDVVAPAVAAAARREQDPDVRVALVQALGAAEDERFVPDLLAWQDDPDPRVRAAVASHLPLMYHGDDPPKDVVDALIALSRDPQPFVRDWATMWLAGLETDAPEVLQALLDRLDDHETSAFDEQDHGEVATDAEALVGLARRRHPVVFDRLVRELDVGEEDFLIGNLYVEAAGELADPRLLPLLLRLQELGWADDPEERRPQLLELAIRACTPEAHRTE